MYATLPFELNPAQKEVIEHGLLTSGFNCVLQMPTGAGKTWLAEEAVLSTLRAGRRVIYITPLRALANELVERWRRRFEGFEVGVFTGEYGPRRAYPTPFEKARLLVMTPERLDACTRYWRTHWDWFPEVGLLVIDELHLLGEPGRGPRLEGAILRARRLNPFLQLLGLSATLGNRAELANWLGGVHFGSDWRPIPISWRCVRFRHATEKPRILREQIECCLAGGGQSLVFVQSRRRAETLAGELAKSGLLAEHHHAGLDSDQRRRLEHEYRAGGIRVLVSTGTLEMGLNLPARQVVLYDLQSFDGTDFVPLSTNTVWQRAGRAGRRGLDTSGEVVLLVPSWDGSAARYSQGQFERITSRLSEAPAVAEQVLVEVSSGLARTRGQLDRALKMSLAAQQCRLAPIHETIEEMLRAGMLVESIDDEPNCAARLKATRLGRIAVRQMLAPSTVAFLARWVRPTSDEIPRSLTFLDLLLLCAATRDCEPLIPVDFEELEDLRRSLVQEYSGLLAGEHATVVRRFELSGRRLLSIIKSALVVREWTRQGNADAVADRFGCYAFEVRRLNESFERLLTAAIAVMIPDKNQEDSPKVDMLGPLCDEEPSLLERVRALCAMVARGIDELTVTLTYIQGIGAVTARRLRDAGVTDIESLALVESPDSLHIQGVSRDRLARWIGEAGEMMRTRSALSLKEFGPALHLPTSIWTNEVDQYRLRRALDLRVERGQDGFLVTGGLEPHLVHQGPGALRCDCADSSKVENCKHILAVRLNKSDPAITTLVDHLKALPISGGLDLYQLWFQGGNR
jgi:helicase